MAMAEDLVISMDEHYVNTNYDGSRSVGVMVEDDTTAPETSNLLPANEESRAPLVLIWFCTGLNWLYQGLKCTMDSTGCLPSPDVVPSSSEYLSTRIRAIMESKSEFETTLESEIEASKAHWSELSAGVDDEEGSSTEKNREVFRRLQQQYNGPVGFFKNWNDDEWAVGEKIAEGAQGEIFKVRFLLPEADWNDSFILKVFKLEGWSLEDLQKQWPPGMLLTANASERGAYWSESGSGVLGGVMLSDGRFGFLMARFWGDLRKVIDIRMEHNGNQVPPFPHNTTLQCMLLIAMGMRELHKDGIVHRDLKASNVLICPKMWEIDGDIVFQEGFNPASDFDFFSIIADFECSHGVWGTTFWRAPEILLGVRNRDVQPSLFTEKSDVYSYAMTCYEILTGRIPLEDVRVNDYDAVLVRHERPGLPSGMQSWIESLLRRCWDDEPSRRPSFVEICEEFNGKGYFEDDAYDEQ